VVLAVYHVDYPLCAGADFQEAFYLERSSFLKKRTKKRLHGCRGLAGDSRAKVFASFFKKKRFPSLS
jgi:hypothetical protein